MARKTMSLAQLGTRSLALAELYRQKEALPRRAERERQRNSLRSSGEGPAVIDINAIWKAALDDAGSKESIDSRRRMNPAWFCNKCSRLIHSRKEVGSGRGVRVYVDQLAAIQYVRLLDSRIDDAIELEVEKRETSSITHDPIGHFIEAAERSPSSLAIAWEKTRAAAQMTSHEFTMAVLDRANKTLRTTSRAASKALTEFLRGEIDRELIRSLKALTGTAGRRNLQAISPVEKHLNRRFLTD